MSIQIAHSLPHISSLNVPSLIWKYLAVFVLSCWISVQLPYLFYLLLFHHIVKKKNEDEILLGISPSLHMLMVYVELLSATCINSVAFKNDDFEFWGILNQCSQLF